MKRAGWYLIAGAAAGFAGVLGLHGAGAATPSSPGPLASGGAGAAPAPAATATGGTSRSGDPAAPSGGAAPARRATGAVVPYGYGELSVTVTVRGTQITAVSVPLLRTAEPYSQQIAEQVLPMLRSEVLAAHSAQIHAVSGATYTSAAYAQSIQSALDKLHVK